MPPQLGLLSGFAAGLISLANYVVARLPAVHVEIIDLSEQSLDSVSCILDKTLSQTQRDRVFVGITATTASYQSALKISQILKNRHPKTCVVLGGHHASADYKTILARHNDIIDLIVVGEGERPLCELIEKYPAIDTVSSLAFCLNGEVHRTQTADQLTQAELDSIPITYGDNGLIGTPGKFDHVTYVSARGCPLQCAFCAVGNDRIRAKSIPAVIRDIDALLEMGFSRIAIEDNFFAHSPKRTRDLCSALAAVKERRNGAFAWDCQTRVESLVRTGTIGLMAKAGCDAVYIGVESFNPDHLAYLNKTAQPDKYLRQLMNQVIPSLLAAGVDCYLNMQFGIPGETTEHQRHTLSVLERLGSLAVNHDRRITIFPQLHVVYPGTVHSLSGVREGRFAEDVFESFTEWESRELPILFWLGEHFAHGTGGIPEGIIKSELLRAGHFEIDSNAVFSILDTLRTIEGIPGLGVFHYGKYLVPKPAREQGCLVC
ncbi:MAG: radical SAM protein [Dehalococcoidia bacterium]|nr:radical SAM protein [Dehalococcoidia bacterium]